MEGGLTQLSPVAPDTDIEECRLAVLEEIVIEMQCEVEVGLEEKDMILEGTRNERQLQRNSGMQRDKNRSGNMLFRSPLADSQDKL